MDNEFKAEELEIAIVELEKWVNEIEEKVWEERVKEEEGWAWGD